MAQAVYVRTAKVKCGQPYCGKAVTYMAPAQVEQFGSTAGGGTVDATATANTTATFTNDEVSTSSTFNIIDSGTPVMRFGFFRASDNTRQVTLFARVYGSGNAYNTKLWAYAPVSGADFHDVYAIPQMPEGEGYSEVGGSLQFLGVTLTVWGWKYTYSYAGDGGPGSISGHLDSTSAFTLTELTET